MARPLRIEYAGAVYHVTSRGNERKPIFLDDEDYERFLIFLAELPTRFEVVIHGYVLMGNHYHLLLETLRPNLQRTMQYLNTAYTVYFNRKRGRAGHLLQGRYKAFLIQKDSYLLGVSRYVHNNPVRARMVDQPQKYRWSSYRDYIGTRKREAWLTREWVLAQFSENEASARRRYKKFVEEGIEKSENPFASVKAGLILGTDTFMEELKRKVPVKTDHDVPQSRHFSDAIPCDALIDVVSTRLGIDKHEITQVGKRDNPARRACLYLLRTLTAMSNGEIAEKFHISHSAVAKASARFKREMKENEELRSLVTDCSLLMSNVKV